MRIVYSDASRGIIEKIEVGSTSVRFGVGIGPSIYVKNGRKNESVELTGENGAYSGEHGGVRFELKHIDGGDSLEIEVKIENRSGSNFAPEALGLKLGIDTCMIEYPQWNDIYFPTLLRCERTHFYGYLKSPMGKIVSIVCDEPVAAWELDYSVCSFHNAELDEEDDESGHFGHRITTANLLLLCQGPLPDRHPKGLSALRDGEALTRRISILPLDSDSGYKQMLAERYGIPTGEFVCYSLAVGERARLSVCSNEKYSVKTTSPSGKLITDTDFKVEEHGIYSSVIETESGKRAEATLHCRHDYGWYLRAARENAVSKPQKATTHAESWYGWFSTFLAKKHYPCEEIDALARANFDEVAPLMFDMEAGEPIVIQSRVQNIAAFVSVLVDLYESDPKENAVYLDYAANMAEALIKRQTPDGAYRRGKTHYTAVIYIAKSMLELALCERELGKAYRERYKRHYESARLAIDDLCRLREQIGTEGEHTLEDGMITCSALQLGFFALTLPEEERAPYIESAEYLMRLHKCLEASEHPDCRVRGGTLRFWEAQYDVMVRGNMLNTPHGWTSWKSYATYYLYLLTGKEEYLIDTVNTVGASIQMIDEARNLRWGFILDPYRRVKVLVPDKDRPIKDGYASSAHLKEPGYRGKYEMQVIGEQYIDMISGWYRTGEQRVTGGYKICPLIFDDHTEDVDSQGGACDNDVHEHFKCLEETLLKKAFVIVDSEKNAHGYGAITEFDGDTLVVTPYEECNLVHVNTPYKMQIKVYNITYNVEAGLTMLALRKKEEI